MKYGGPRSKHNQKCIFEFTQKIRYKNKNYVDRPRRSNRQTSIGIFVEEGTPRSFSGKKTEKLLCVEKVFK